MRLPALPYSDGDGLSDDAERIIGTSRSAQDTDGDGISDWTAIFEGLDPLSGFRDGLLDSTDTPGTPVDVWALDNYLVADYEEGVSVFNVLNRMSQVIMSQVDTHGSALALASWSNQVVVSHGAAGMHVIDISDPPAARIDFSLGSVSLGHGRRQAATAAHGLAYLGTILGLPLLINGTSLFVINNAKALRS